jgi:Flp pilus assembly protein TadD
LDIVASSALISSPCRSLRLATESLARGEALADCRRQVEADPDDVDGRVALAEALLDDGSLAEAFADLDYVLTRQPDNGPARTALGRWHDGQGALAEARHQWLRAGQLGELEAWVLLGNSYPLDEVPTEVAAALRLELRRAEEERRLTGTLYYRSKFFRVSPETILLPGEWQRAVPGRIVRAEEALARWTAGADAP